MDLDSLPMHVCPAHGCSCQIRVIEYLEATRSTSIWVLIIDLGLMRGLFLVPVLIGILICVSTLSGLPFDMSPLMTFFLGNFRHEAMVIILLKSQKHGRE